MAKTFDFNTLTRPVLPLVMCDEAKTLIEVTTPYESLVEDLEAILPELQNLKDKEDTEDTETEAVCYDLAARLISCNTEELEVTADDLRTKYWPKDRILNQIHLMKFFSLYLGFIREINNAKN